MLYLVLCRTRAWWIPSWCLWSSWDPSTTFSRFVCLSASVSIMMHKVICCTNSVQGSVPASKGQQMMHIVNFSFLFLAESMFPTHHEKAWCIWSLGWLFWRCTFGLWLKISLLAFSVVVIFKYSSVQNAHMFLTLWLEEKSWRGWCLVLEKQPKTLISYSRPWTWTLVCYHDEHCFRTLIQRNARWSARLYALWPTSMVLVFR